MEQPLPLQPLIGVDDVDVVGASLVGGAGDLARQLLLADVARHADELPGLHVGAEADDQVGEAPGEVGVGRCTTRETSDNGPMRLNRYLARAGVASRRAADDLIKAGRVTVNGERGELNTFVAARDVVEVDGERVGKQELAHVLLHKPLGVVTTASDPQRRPTVVDLVGHDARVVPVGRLDIDTSGVLLLTNDGDLAHRLAHPRYGVEKTYVADVDGDLTAAAVPALADGVELEDGATAPARARQLGRSRVELVLHEGRNRQVRRMCEAVGFPVVRLRRTAYAGLGVEGLEPGTWRPLTRAEVEALRRLVGL